MNPTLKLRLEPSLETRYGLALFLTVAALLVSLAVRPLVQINAFILLQGVVFISAWYGGLGPGLVSAGFSIVAMGFFFIPPVFTFRFSWVDGGVDLFVFGLIALVVSSLSARLRDAHARLARAHEGLEEKIKERTEQLSSEVEHRLEAERAILEISHREQQRMGQDLHDGLCQTLAGARLVAEALNDQMTQKGLQEKVYVDKIESLLSKALLQSDSVSRGLYPVELEENGLVSALLELCQNVSHTYGIQCRLQGGLGMSLANGVMGTHFFRIAQEAVMNAVKAGKARSILIRFFQFKSHHLMVIADNGKGFDPASMRRGMGLKIMDYRARILNASFQLRRRRRGGSLAVCRFDARLNERTPALGS